MILQLYVKLISIPDGGMYGKLVNTIHPAGIPAELTVIFSFTNREFTCVWSVFVDREKEYRPFIFRVPHLYAASGFEYTWQYPGSEKIFTWSPAHPEMALAEQARDYLVGQTVSPLRIFRSQINTMVPETGCREREVRQMELGPAEYQFPTISLPIELPESLEPSFREFFAEYASLLPIS